MKITITLAQYLESGGLLENLNMEKTYCTVGLLSREKVLLITPSNKTKSQRFDLIVKSEFINEISIEFTRNAVSAELIETEVDVLLKSEVPTKTDRLFIQEIINDLRKHGYVEGGKADTMLTDWSRELKEKSGLAGKTKKTHAKLVGRNNY